MDNTKKLEILNRLTKEGYITLDEALILLETEKEYIYQGKYIPWQVIPNKLPKGIYPSQPYTNPCTPNVPDWTYRPGVVTYGSTTTNDFFHQFVTV